MARPGLEYLAKVSFKSKTFANQARMALRDGGFEATIERGLFFTRLVVHCDVPTLLAAKAAMEQGRWSSPALKEWERQSRAAKTIIGPFWRADTGR